MFGTQISVKEALAMIPGQSKKRLDEIVEKYHLFTYGMGKNTIYVKEILHLALNVEFIKNLYSRFGQEWLNEYTKINGGGYANPLIYSLTGEDIIRNKFTGLIISEVNTTEESLIVPIATTKKIDITKPLKPIPAKVVTNVRISIYCKKCRRSIDSKSEKDIVCKHSAENLFYRARYAVPKTVPRKYLVLQLNARTTEDAIAEARIFKNSHLLKQKGDLIDSKPARLIDTMKIYEEIVRNENNKYSANTNTQNHIKDICRNLKYMREGLAHNGYHLEKILTTQITPLIGKQIANYLRIEKGLKASHKRAVGQLATFFRWAREEMGYQMLQPFYKIDFEPCNIEPIAISESALKSILDALEDPASYIGHPKNPGVNQNHSKWIRNAYILSALTGRRREELVTMKWSNIIINERGTTILKGGNLKVNRQKNEMKSATKRMFSIPLFPELKHFLTQLGYEQKKGSDEYILHPEYNQGKRTISRSQMIEKLSRSFSFLHKTIIGGGNDLEFKSIRKVFTTRAKTEYGDRALYLTDHSSNNMLDVHYVFKNEFFVEVERNFRVFESGIVLPPVLLSDKNNNLNT